MIKKKLRFLVRIIGEHGIAWWQENIERIDENFNYATSSWPLGTSETARYLTVFCLRIRILIQFRVSLLLKKKIHSFTITTPLQGWSCSLAAVWLLRMGLGWKRSWIAAVFIVLLSKFSLCLIDQMFSCKVRGKLNFKWDSDEIDSIAVLNGD